jgi:hypothetical protein
MCRTRTFCVVVPSGTGTHAAYDAAECRRAGARRGPGLTGRWDMRALVTGGAGFIGSYLVDARLDLLDIFTERASRLEEQSVGE